MVEEDFVGLFWKTIFDFSIFWPNYSIEGISGLIKPSVEKNRPDHLKALQRQQ